MDLYTIVVHIAIIVISFYICKFIEKKTHGRLLHGLKDKLTALVNRIVGWLDSNSNAWHRHIRQTENTQRRSQPRPEPIPRTNNQMENRTTQRRTSQLDAQSQLRPQPQPNTVLYGNNATENRAPQRRPLVPADRNNITETGQMIYFANDRHGRSDKEYRFNYKKVGDGWRAYILKMPSLGNHSSESAIIHRLHDSNGYYICWDRPVNSLKDMQNISRRWADSIQTYIATGHFG